MQSAPLPKDEAERLKAVHDMGILDTPKEERFDRITREAVKQLGVPISTITIMDSDREWYKSCQGVEQKDVPRTISFCAHALLARDIFIVDDTLNDDRFKDNPMVTGAPFIRFYAGIALISYKTKQNIGVFCIKDTKPRKFSMAEIDIMSELAEQAEKELNARI
jgi:GAF domain-containing protein